MKRNALLVIMTLAPLFAVGQVRTTKLTVYNSYRPAIITLADGRTLKQPLTNVFLKNAALLYMSGNQAKEANMKTVVSVQFDDRLYVRIDSLLAFQVDSAGADGLYRATIIDREAYEQNLKNNVVLSDLSLLNSDMVGTTTVDLNNESDYEFPLINIYYFRYKGKFVRCHDRSLSNFLPKEKRRLMRSYIRMPDFSWTDEKSLIQLLKGLQ